MILSYIGLHMYDTVIHCAANACLYCHALGSTSMARHTDFTLPDDRLVFGMVSHTDEDQTTYCFSIVAKH
jgi:hypothetical protein